MQRTEERRQAVGELVGAIAQEITEARREVDVFADVPVPQPGLRTAHGHREALLALPQRQFSLLAVGDVLERAADLQGPPVLPHRGARGADPDAPSRRRDEPQLEVVARPGLHRRAKRLGDHRDRLGREEPHRALERGQVLLRREIVDPVGLVGPEQRAGLEVGLPAPDAAHRLGDPQELRRALQARVGLPAAHGQLCRRDLRRMRHGSVGGGGSSIASGAAAFPAGLAPYSTPPGASGQAPARHAGPPPTARPSPPRSTARTRRPG